MRRPRPSGPAEECGARPGARGPRRGRRPPAFAAATLLALLALACGGQGDDGEPEPAPTPPDLTGARVMLLPVRAPAPEPVDAELAFWLEQRSPSTDWVLPTQLQAAADRAPAWRLRLDALQRTVGDMGGGDRRATDPLYGALRQLGAVVNADVAVVPISVLALEEEGAHVAAMTVAVIGIHGGHVLWMHTVRGALSPERPGAIASAAEAVARTLFP